GGAAADECWGQAGVAVLRVHGAEQRCWGQVEACEEVVLADVYPAPAPAEREDDVGVAEQEPVLEVPRRPDQGAARQIQVQDVPNILCVQPAELAYIETHQLFGAIPHYDIELGSWAYSSLVLACINSGMEEGFVRAVETSTEAVEKSIESGTNALNYEAASKLVEEFTKRNDSENAKVYVDYIVKYNLKPSPSYHVAFDENGKTIFKEFEPKN
ncbi:hypothetical protein AYI70_g3332, partial [Smittium culicis]